MANQQMLNLLKKSVPKWNQWRKNNPSKFIDLHDADLKAISLNRANLHAADLSSSSLCETDLSEANLIECKISNADLRAANLHKADLHHADLSASDLSDANLHSARLVDADLWRAEMMCANFTAADLKMTNLNSADLSSAIMCDADISEADLSSAKLTNANLIGAVLNKADLNRADLCRAKLSSASLTQANLAECNLTEAMMMQADLQDAILHGANLTGADLWQANLMHTDLSYANLNEANLSDAKLSFADMWRCDLTRVNLTSTDFKHIILHESVFADVDLSSVKNIKSSICIGPSVLDFRTLQKSHRLPIGFLKCCGLADWQIASSHLYKKDLSREDIRSVLYKLVQVLIKKPVQYYSCFISYSIKDEEFVRKLFNNLQNNGIRCWFIPDKIVGREKLCKRIYTTIRAYDKLLLIVSKNSVKDEWLHEDIEAAARMEQQTEKTVLFPIVLDNALLNTDNTKILKLKQNRHIGYFTNWQERQNYKKSFVRLIRDLRTAN